MIVQFYCIVSIDAVCSQCHEDTELQTTAVFAGSTIPYPVLPDGWRTVDGFPVCPKHDVKIEDKAP